LAGLLRPTSGSIYLLGKDVVAMPDVVPHLVGYYGQLVRILQAFRFSEALWMTGMLRGMSMSEARRQAQALMEQFDVTHLSQKVIGRLSGGEARLAGVLATFMGNRPILILDEPTNDLDPVRRRILWDYLHEKNVTEGTTVIIVSHNLSELETVAHQAALIDKGKLLASGSMGDLKRAVADKVRIEFSVRNGVGVSDLLVDYEDVRQVKPGVWGIYAKPEVAPKLLHRLIDVLGIELIDDFRLITPTLEDVYLFFTRKDREGCGHGTYGDTCDQEDGR
jgi:ABC-type multidrug transport system ATPase subunit